MIRLLLLLLLTLPTLAEDPRVARDRLDQLDRAIAVDYPLKHRGAYPPADWAAILPFLDASRGWTLELLRKRYVYNALYAGQAASRAGVPMVIDLQPLADRRYRAVIYKAGVEYRTSASLFAQPLTPAARGLLVKYLRL